MRKQFMVFTVFGVLVVLVFATSNAQLRQAKSGVELFETGMYYGDEVPIQAGEQVLGLHIGDQGSLILPYRLTVKPALDESSFHGTGREKGKVVTVDLPLDPLFLLKGATMLSEGPVTTIFTGVDETSWKPLVKGPPVDFQLAGAAYSLEVIGSGDNSECSDEGLPHNARLVLKSGEEAQTVHSLGWYCGVDASWFLIWAGDLDRDGKLDIYLNLNEGYGSEKRLLLSSRAGKSQLVKEIAQLVTTCGC